MLPWLSVLIPVYNVKPFLKECVDSVLEQYLEGVEIIALDDKSTDGTFAELTALAEVAPVQIRILQHDFNKGLSGARNSLIDEAQGDYLWFLDSDDALEKGAIAELKKIIDKYSPDLILCDYKIWRPDVVHQKMKELHVASFDGMPRVLRQDSEALFKGLYAKGKLHAWSKIAKRHFWDKSLRFPEGKFFEDMVTTPRLALRVKNYYYQDQVWVKYRQRAGSILAVPSLKKVEDMSTGVDGVLDEWIKKCPSMTPSARFAFTQYNVKLYYFILKELKRIQLDNTSVFKERFFKNVGLNKLGLIKAYVLQGQVGRLFKVLIKLI